MNLAEFCFEQSLYSKIPLGLGDGDDVAPIYRWKGRYDCFCPFCKKETVVNLPKSMADRFGFNYMEGSQKYMEVTFLCARNARHKMVFYMVHDGETLIKIGQFPSVADLQMGELNKFRTVLEKEESGEFRKAIGLSAHDTGIGAFIYLRRVLEKIVDKRGKEAIADNTIAEDEFANARVAEKIRMLDGYLPEVLVSNAKLYGVLSKGVHELTEEECLRAFPAIRDLMFFVLEEDLERSEKEKLLKAAEKAIRSL